MTRTVLALVCALLWHAVGCAELPALDATCGNFTLDPSEDCDGDASGACDAACNLHCGADGACPEGYACGVDRLCHAPSGRVVANPTSIPVQSDSYAVTDVDRDGFGDVVVLASTALDVVHGGQAPVLSRRTTTLTPRSFGPPAFTHLDADPTLDLLVPTTNGVAGYSSAFGELAPHPVAIDLDQSETCAVELGQAFQVFSLHDQYLGVLTRQVSTGKLALAVIDGAKKSACPFQNDRICNINLPPMRTFDAYVDVYPDVDRTGKIIAIVLPQYGTCVVDTNDLGGDHFDVKDITPLGASLTSPPVLARIRGGGCPSLLDADAAPSAVLEYKPTGAPGMCGFAPGPPPMLPLVDSSIPPDAKVIGRVPLSPLVPGHAADALMLSSGAFAIPLVGSTLKEVYQSDRRLDVVRAIDIDSDGDVDTVGFVYGGSDLDVLTRTPGGSFLGLRIATGPLLGVELGDYDGNGAGDVAYAELQPSGRGRLSIAYGTRDRLLEGTPVGTFSQIVGLCVFQAPDATDQEDIIDDLVVFDLPLDQPMRRQPLLSVLHGSPQRTMVSYFDPRTGQEPDEAFIGVAAGEFFASPSTATPTATDLIAISSAGAAVQMWPLRGTTPGVLEFTAKPPDVPALINCSRAAAGAVSTKMCAEDATYLTWPGPSHDVVLAVENRGSSSRAFAILDPTQFASGGVVATRYGAPNALSAVDPALDARSLHAVDTDGDHRAELVAAFGVPALYDPTGASGVVMICGVDDGGVPRTCTSIGDLVPELAGLACVDAAPAHLAPRGRGRFDHPPADDAQELAVACHANTPDVESRIYRVFHDPAGYHANLVTARPGSIERIAVGDVNGDGLDDLLALEVTPASLFPNLVALTQCSSRDTTACSP